MPRALLDSIGHGEAKYLTGVDKDVPIEFGHYNKQGRHLSKSVE